MSPQVFRGSTKGSSLTALPVEILGMVVEACLMPGFTGFTDGVETLLSLRLTNRLLREIATPLAFRKVFLEEWPGFLTAIERMGGLTDHSFAHFIHELCLTPHVAPDDIDETMDFSVLDKFLAACYHNIHTLNILVWRCPHWPDKSDLPFFNSKILWKMGDMFRAKPMDALTSLHLYVEFPGHLRYLYDPSAYDGIVNGALYWLEEAHVPAYFPFLKSLDVNFRLQPWFNYPVEYMALPDALRLLRTGCSRLRHLGVRVQVDHGPQKYKDRIGWPHGILLDTPGFRPSNLKSLVLSLPVELNDTSLILDVLEGMDNLEKLEVGEFTIKKPRPEFDDAAISYVGWSDVFERLRAIDTLKDYHFHRLVTMPHSRKSEVADEDAFWAHVREDFASDSVVEFQDLDRLKVAVANRRREAGLPEDWNDGSRGAKPDLRYPEVD